MNNKINLKILKRQLDSYEKLTHKLVKQLYDIISNYNITISDNFSILIIIDNMIYNSDQKQHQEDDDEISSIELNNSDLKNKYDN